MVSPHNSDVSVVLAEAANDLRYALLYAVTLVDDLSVG